jgi:hypothetical protein
MLTAPSLTTAIEGLFDIYPSAGDAVAALGGESDTQSPE